VGGSLAETEQVVEAKQAVEADHVEAVEQAVEDAQSEEAVSELGPASSCVLSSECSRNDICQQLANNGGHPLSGTVACKECIGSTKCQKFGTGSALTCGCTVP